MRIVLTPPDSAPVVVRDSTHKLVPHAVRLSLAAGSNTGEIGIFDVRDPAGAGRGCSFSACRTLLRGGHSEVRTFYQTCFCCRVKHSGYCVGRILCAARG